MKRLLNWLGLVAAVVSTPYALQHVPQTVKLELLVFSDCPNSPKMRSSVEAALRKLKWKVNIKTVDLTKLPKADPRSGYGAPTLLVNGKDLLGLARNPSGAVSCRIYPGGGVPSINQIVEALKHKR